MMAVVKCILLFVEAVAQHFGSTSPNVRPPAEQLREQRGTEILLPRFAKLARVLLLSWALLEATIILSFSGRYPPALARLLLCVLPPAPDADPTTISPGFLAGTVLTVFGTLLRVHCYRVLGSRFTYELSIRPAHALVTEGVYSVVRHPSYTGAFAIMFGSFLCMLDPRGWIASALVHAGAIFIRIGGPMLWSGGDGPVQLGPVVVDARAIATGVLACVWATLVGTISYMMFKRMDNEDAMLEKNFGGEWRAWANKVPRRLVPGIY